MKFHLLFSRLLILICYSCLKLSGQSMYERFLHTVAKGKEHVETVTSVPMVVVKSQQKHGSCMPSPIDSIKPDGIKTAQGNYVINHTNNNGIRPKSGDYFTFHANLIVGDTLINDTRKNDSEPHELIIPDTTLMPAGRKIHAIFEGAVLATINDSITIYQPMDSSLAKELPERLKLEKYMQFNLVIYSITTNEVKEKSSQDMKDRLPEIKVIMNTMTRSYKSKAFRKQIPTLPSGLGIIIKEKGNGGTLKTGSTIKCNYYSVLKNGKMVDNSFERGESFTFKFGEGMVIAGFEEGVQQFNHGGKGILFIPPALGYGDKDITNQIPPNSVLIFYVEVL